MVEQWAAVAFATRLTCRAWRKVSKVLPKAEDDPPTFLVVVVVDR